MRKCDGVCVAGVWRGSECEASAKYKSFNGKFYCGDHFAIAENTPGRFDEAVIDKGEMVLLKEAGRI